MIKKVMVIAALCVINYASYAQANLPDTDSVIRTEHFEVSGDGADSIAKQMEERFGVYNRLLRFDPAVLSRPLKVISIEDTDAYNQYVSTRAGAVTPGAVYLHYAQLDKRELVINHDKADEANALPYQAFIQFFRAFISQPPEWMREGFAVFFATLGFDSAGQLTYEENLAWLETVKKMKSRPPLEAVLRANEGAQNGFQALAWSLVSFLLNSGNEDHLRSLTDSFMTLSDTATAAQNDEAVLKRLLLYSSMETLASDYQKYLDSRRTFNELAAEGERLFAAGDNAGAEAAFRSAMHLKPANHVPPYYLGLIAYNAGVFGLAEEYYRASLQNGADSALVLYALGLNSAAAGKSVEAVDYLRQAAAAAPDRYKARAEQIIARISGK